VARTRNPSSRGKLARHNRSSGGARRSAQIGAEDWGNKKWRTTKAGRTRHTGAPAQKKVMREAEEDEGSRDPARSAPNPRQHAGGALVLANDMPLGMLRGALFVGNPTNGPRVRGNRKPYACCGCMGGPAFKGGAPMSTIAAAAQTADRLLDPSSCDPALLRNPSLSKPKQVQSRSRQTRLALSNWAKPQGSVRRPLPSHAPASRGARQATRNAKIG
jgi:hypothetical protein